jgi:hypothetical protein
MGAGAVGGTVILLAVCALVLLALPVGLMIVAPGWYSTKLRIAVSCLVSALVYLAIAGFIYLLTVTK